MRSNYTITKVTTITESASLIFDKDDPSCAVEYLAINGGNKSESTVYTITEKPEPKEQET